MKLDINETRKLCTDEERFSSELISTIIQNNWLNIWVPEKFGGSNLNLTQGLKFLKSLAQADGSLGWMVTLCSGANYFVRNIEPSAAEKMFSQTIFFGGSGMVGGVAERTENGYMLSGKWKYATGAPFLTHFTMNARITQNGEDVEDSDGQKILKSFIVSATDVKIIEDWDTMGMKATATHSFEIDRVFVPREHTFTYNHFYGDDILDRIPFLTFADLTLAVNFLGMALHLSEAFDEEHPAGKIFIHQIKETESSFFKLTKDVETDLAAKKSFNDNRIAEIHQKCVAMVKNLTSETLNAYISLGIRAAYPVSEYNRVFRDFFTATQHTHFRN